MKKDIAIIIFVHFFSLISLAQTDTLFNRLKAINNNGMSFYNVDGINISHQTFNYSFTEKNLKKVYRKYSIKKGDLKTKDNDISYDNFRVIKTDKITDDLNQINIYYFLENNEKRTDVFWFGGYGTDNNKELEHNLITSIVNNKIPDNCFSKKDTNSVDFIGRELKLGGNCYWANVNNIQCPYNGQINWSIHKDKESSDSSNQHQLSLTKSKKYGNVISENDVDILFEEIPTKAKKVVFDFNGVTSLIAGGENLTIYYVSEKIRGQYISCVLSFWNNDNITANGLTPLLEEVMKFPEK